MGLMSIKYLNKKRKPLAVRLPLRVLEKKGQCTPIEVEMQQIKYKPH